MIAESEGSAPVPEQIFTRIIIHYPINPADRSAFSFSKKSNDNKVDMMNEKDDATEMGQGTLHAWKSAEHEVDGIIEEINGTLADMQNTMADMQNTMVDIQNNMLTMEKLNSIIAETLNSVMERCFDQLNVTHKEEGVEDTWRAQVEAKVSKTMKDLISKHIGQRSILQKTLDR